MINHFCKKYLWECSKNLSDVAMGRVPAETVIKNAKLINVCTKEIIENTDVAISSGRIALVGDATHCIGKDTLVLDAQGQYICPGFMDGHIHIESSMLSAGEYAKSIIPHGTTGIYFDPHEIYNVLGPEAMKCMLEDCNRTSLKGMLTVPSCVPAVPGFEDTGSFVGPDDVKEMMKDDAVVGLGEMMNFPGLLNSTDHAHGIVAETLKSGKIATGHFSIPDVDKGLNAYVATGVRCCHESTSMQEALAKMRLGMYAMLREGSAWLDLHETVKSILEHKIDTRFAVMISDDTHPHTLIGKGHMDHIVRRAIEEGVDPITAIQMVTINCAQCFQMDHDLGSIAPGKCADIVFLSDLEKVQVTKVLIDGEVVAENGKMVNEFEPYKYPEWVTNSMHIKGKITPESFAIKTQNEKETVRVIEIIPAKVGTYEKHVELVAKNGQIHSDVSQDILKTAVFERHHETGTVGYGFVKGFGIKNGAMAATVAHDAHNLLVVGSNDDDMAFAANTLIECGGGLCVVENGKIVALVELPIAGLMNDLPVEIMNEKILNLERAWEKIGCTMPSPFMTMALIPLACLPCLRLTNRGLVDCTTFSQVDLFVKK